MTTELQRLSSFGFMLSKQHLAEKDYEKLRQHGAELEELYSKAIEKAQAIDSSDEFTSAGKRRQKKELTEEIKKELEKYHRLAEKEMAFVDGPSIALELAQLRGSMKRTADAVDPVLKELQHQERRKYLLTLDPVERESMIRAAAGRGDYSLLDAAVTGPQPSTTFVLDKTKEQLESQRLQAMHPQSAQRIEELESARRHLQGMVAALQSSLRKQGLFDQPEAEIEFLPQQAS